MGTIGLMFFMPERTASLKTFSWTKHKGKAYKSQKIKNQNPHTKLNGPLVKPVGGPFRTGCVQQCTAWAGYWSVNLWFSKGLCWLIQSITLCFFWELGYLFSADADKEVQSRKPSKDGIQHLLRSGLSSVSPFGHILHLAGMGTSIRCQGLGWTRWASRPGPPHPWKRWLQPELVCKWVILRNNPMKQKWRPRKWEWEAGKSINTRGCHGLGHLRRPLRFKIAKRMEEVP